MQFDRSGEVHEHLHYPVEAMNFAADHIDVPGGVGLEFGQLVAQVFQVQNYGVDGILDFVRHA